jgi:hypothetical protein
VLEELKERGIEVEALHTGEAVKRSASRTSGGRRRRFI